MKYDIEIDYVVGTCNNGVKFIFDHEDYDKIKNYTCYLSRKNIYIQIGKNAISLSKYLIGSSDKERVKFKNGNYLDYRRSNLYNGNTYEFF